MFSEPQAPHSPKETQANAFLLGTCYYRAGQFHRVVEILQGAWARIRRDREDFRFERVSLNHAGGASTASRHLLAQAHYELRRYAEAETALCPDGDRTEVLQCRGAPGPWLGRGDGPFLHFSRTLLLSQIACGAAGYYLMGLICKRTDRSAAAIQYFSGAVKLDPFFWAAFEQLSLLGAEEQAASCFTQSRFVQTRQISPCLCPHRPPVLTLPPPSLRSLGQLITAGSIAEVQMFATPARRSLPDASAFPQGTQQPATGNFSPPAVRRARPPRPWSRSGG